MKYFFIKGMAQGWGFWGLLNTGLIGLYFLFAPPEDMKLINELNNLGFLSFTLFCLFIITFWLFPPVWIGYELIRLPAEPVPPKWHKRMSRFYGTLTGMFLFCLLNFLILYAGETITGLDLI